MDSHPPAWPDPPNISLARGIQDAWKTNPQFRDAWRKYMRANLIARGVISGERKRSHLPQEE